MISTQKTVPLLVHEDCLGDLSANIDAQINEGALATNVDVITEQVSQVHDDMGGLGPSESTIQDRLADAESHLGNIENELGKQSDAAGSNTISGQIKQISAATGHSTDTAEENSVIGLLKSIVNKLS